MSWKPEVYDRGWAGNGMAFETKEEAELWARDLLNRWFVPTDSRAVESDEPVNYAIIQGILCTVIPRYGLIEDANAPLSELTEDVIS